MFSYQDMESIYVMIRLYCFTKVNNEFGTVIILGSEKLGYIVFETSYYYRVRKYNCYECIEGSPESRTNFETFVSTDFRLYLLNVY